MQLSEYWTIARKRAARAIEEAGILPSRASPATGIARLFPKILQASPLQDYVSQCELIKKPQLWIVEDVTGSGKTEAALTLTHRMMANGLGEGAFVALPTMATANAMYDRVASAYRRLFSEECVPSLILAHSARRLSASFRQSIIRDTKDDEPNPPASEDDAGPVCAAWLADNRKKALLADVGFGTLDQALLAVLRSNHQSLRLLGFCRKILIVDEVHSYDPYMNQLLQSLLRFQAALGGSAVLLSATVPESIRRDMIAAFYDGLGGEVPLPTAVTFPLATCVCPDNLVEVGTGHRPDLRRTVRVELIHDLEAVVSYTVEAARNGAAVCWVRNTVANAREAFDLVRGRWETPERVRLFHARFSIVGFGVRPEATSLGSTKEFTRFHVHSLCLSAGDHGEEEDDKLGKR